MINQLKELVKALRPVKTKFELIRLGGANDGGYLIPNDLEGIVACYSPGVADTASFEVDLCKRGIGSHLADGSVDGAPKGFTPRSFTKKYLDGYNDEDNIDLVNWLIKTEAFHSKNSGDLILQMDIEGGEYTTIINTSRGLLENFRIICIEVHDTDAWFNPIAWNTVSTFFAKLTQEFHVVHNHPNNNCGTVNANGFILPRVFELTLLRKDRSEALGFVEDLPHPLDAPNVTDKPVLELPKEWYGA
jgi:hypothetical protein